MKYTKTISPLKNGARVSVVLEFDRVLSPRTAYASWVGETCLGDSIPENVASLLAAVATVPGVNNHRDGHTNVRGNQLELEIISITPTPVREIVKTVLKRIQRRVAPMEGRKMVKSHN